MSSDMSIATGTFYSTTVYFANWKFNVKFSGSVHRRVWHFFQFRVPFQWKAWHMWKRRLLARERRAKRTDRQTHQRRRSTETECWKDCFLTAVYIFAKCHKVFVSVLQSCIDVVIPLVQNFIPLIGSKWKIICGEKMTFKNFNSKPSFRNDILTIHCKWLFLHLQWKLLTARSENLSK